MRYVLFVCNHNAGRSQMAQAFFERHAPDDVRAESAGSSPARQVWPTVVEAMAEVGLDLSERKPRKLIRELQLHADWAVTMGCGDVCPYVPTTVEAWDIPDPAGLPLEQVRPIRDEIECTCSTSSRPGSTRSARTRPRTASASCTCCPSSPTSSRPRDAAEEIRACADAVLTGYDDACGALCLHAGPGLPPDTRVPAQGRLRRARRRVRMRAPLLMNQALQPQVVRDHRAVGRGIRRCTRETVGPSFQFVEPFIPMAARHHPPC